MPPKTMPPLENFMALTDTSIRNAKPGRHFDGGGLYIEVTGAGSKLWRYKYRIAGKEKRIALGAYPEISLKDARERHADARKLVARGIDPSAERKAAKAQDAADAGNTFRHWSGLWLAHWRIGRSERHAGYVERRLEALIHPTLGEMPMSAITASSVRVCVQKVAASGTLDLAKRTHQMIGQVFRFTIAHDGADRNPARDIVPADIIPAATKTHYNRVDEKELPDLLRAIEAATISPLTRCAIKLLAHTFVRTSELIGARWAEFDNSQWRIPAERMKMKSEHIVPLSTQSLEIVATIREIHRQQNIKSDYLFPIQVAGKTGTMSNTTILRALERMGYKGEMTGHGFRGIASTILHEQQFPHEHIELQLAHMRRDAVSASYDYAKHLAPRAAMMQHWSDHLDTIRK